MTADGIDEYRAVVAKVDAAVAGAVAAAGDAVTCHNGCDSCCVGGLSVLPVEAARILADAPALQTAMPAQARAGMCAFLHADGACAIYAVRPLLCRTHGLPLRRTAETGLPIVDVCHLNFTARAPSPADTLDAERIQVLLTVVDQRYRDAVGADDGRVPLSHLAERLR